MREAGRERLGLSQLLLTAVLVATGGVLVAALFTAFGSQNPNELGWDFRVAYFPAAEAVLEGRSPYPADPNDPMLDVPTLYAYPPQLAVLLSPLAALPVDVAVVLAVVASLAALMGALYLVGVRDLRCYAVVPIWGSAWNALEMANVSALLALLLAVAWRFRETLWPLAAALGTMVALKLVMWPLLVWAVATRRIRAAVLALGVSVATTLAAWAVVGFAGFLDYPDLLARIEGQESYSIADMMSALGFGADAGRVATLLVGGAVLVACVALARAGDERRAFVVAVAAALALSPILWLHYLALLVVPLGLMRPRFSAIWLLPIVLWVSPKSENGVGFEPFVPALVAAALLLVLLVRPGAHERVAEAPA